MAKPISVYAMACAYELEDISRIAARRSPFGADYVEELDLISTRTFHKLSACRSQCIAAALKGTDACYDARENYNILRGCMGNPYCSPKQRLYTDLRASWATYFGEALTVARADPRRDEGVFSVVVGASY